MFLIGIPLLIIPFAIYNIIALLMPGVRWTDQIAGISMMSGATWTITPEDALITLAILLLFVEIFKASRVSSSRSLINHMLSMLLFIAMLVEFLLVQRAGTSTFFILMVISLVDAMAGFIITARTAQRDVQIDRTIEPPI